MRYKIEVFVESALIMINIPSYILNIFVHLKRVNKHPTQKHPIILVERWFRHNALHAFAKWYLEKQGFEVYSINYSLLKGTFEDAARKLSLLITEKKLEDVVLVGISAGALTCITYLQLLDGWKHTYRFVSIGGALLGSPKAKSYPFTPSLKQLDPSSPFIAEIYKTEIKHKDRIYSLYTTKDKIVPPAYSKIPGIKLVQMHMAGHNLLHTFWLPTYKKVVEIAKD